MTIRCVQKGTTLALDFNLRIKAIDPERFRFAFDLYFAAAAMKGPYRNPEMFRVNVAEDDGSTSEIRFIDGPENRGMMAVKEEFRDPDEFQSIVFRILTDPQADSGSAPTRIRFDSQRRGRYRNLRTRNQCHGGGSVSEIRRT